MSTIRCKFVCQGVTKNAHWDKEKSPFIYNARFTVVHDGSAENKAFFASTPTGELTVGSMASGEFEPGQDYYIDITHAPRSAP